MTQNERRALIYESINTELRWRGDQSDKALLVWMAIIGEEVGEACKALLEEDGGLREELIQVAACAIAAIEALDYQRDE